MPTDSPVALSREDDQYGLIVYEGAYYDNIGDEMQSLAALQFLPRVDHLIPIDRVHSFRSPTGRPVKVIMNGYFSCDPDAWPPSSDIQPLFLSFHLASVGLPGAPYSGPNAGRAAADVWVEGEKRDYLRGVGPIGCRDLATQQRLQSAGIEAHFSGCLTLTLDSKLKHRSGQVAIVDAEADTELLLSTMPKPVRDRVVFQSHTFSNAGEWPPSRRIAHAQELLWLYAGCALCVTSRLHCALPCFAVGTPVIYVSTSREPARLTGLEPLINVVLPDQLSTLGGAYWTNPPANPDLHLDLRELLVKRCRQFCGGTAGGPGCGHA